MLELDPRIHFALNCGAAGCPPFAVYSDEAERLESQLALATKGFLDGSISFNKEKKSINLSQLFKWYRSDFGSTDKEVLEWIQNNASISMRDNIAAFLRDINEFPKFEYDAYDWSLNGSL